MFRRKRTRVGRETDWELLGTLLPHFVRFTENNQSTSHTFDPFGAAKSAELSRTLLRKWKCAQTHRKSLSRFLFSILYLLLPSCKWAVGEISRSPRSRSGMRKRIEWTEIDECGCAARKLTAHFPDAQTHYYRIEEMKTQPLFIHLLLDCSAIAAWVFGWWLN